MNATLSCLMLVPLSPVSVDSPVGTLPDTALIAAFISLDHCPLTAQHPPLLLIEIRHTSPARVNAADTMRMLGSTISLDSPVTSSIS